MTEPALNTARIDPLDLVKFHMSRIRGLVVELRKFVPETVYDMDISWHPAAKHIAQEIVTACREENISATYETPRDKDKAKYQLRINLQRLVRNVPDLPLVSD